MRKFKIGDKVKYIQVGAGYSDIPNGFEANIIDIEEIPVLERIRNVGIYGQQTYYVSIIDHNGDRRDMYPYRVSLIESKINKQILIL